MEATVQSINTTII